MSKRTGIVLAILLALAAFARIHYFTGLQTGDDIVYSRILVDRLNGKVGVSMTQEARSGFLLPMLVSYRLFGAGEIQLVLYNLICSVGLVAAVFFLSLRHSNALGAAVSGLVTAFHPNLVRHASECHADTPLALWLALAVLVFRSALDADPGARRRILAGVLLGWAYLHKESTIYMGLFFAGHWIATRRDWKWYLPIAVPVLATFVAELIGFAVLTGNPLERYAVIRHWHTQYMAEKYTTAGSILHRQFVELPLLLFTPWYGRNFTGLVNLACAGAGAFLLWKRDPAARGMAGWFLTFYLAYCFWPSSLSPFMPGFFLFEWTLPVFVAPLAVLLGGAVPRVHRRAAAVGAVALLLCCLTTLQSGRVEGARYASGAKEARGWLQAHPSARVVTDDKTVENLDFLEGHRPSRQYLPFQSTSELAGAAVIVDKFWSEPGRWWSRPVPAIALHPPAAWRKVFESDRIVIYRP